MKHSPSTDFAQTSQFPTVTSPEDYLRRLHPERMRGNPSLLMLGDKGPISECAPTEQICAVLPVWLDDTSYASLNRFYGRRTNKNLAQLNAVYLDLDFHTRSQWAGKSASHVQMAFQTSLNAAAIPTPSIYLHTGRGLAVIWLINPLPAKAQKRWQGAMNAVIKFAARFGADPACKDAARVFRIPGTINEKSGTEVRVSDATWYRHDFDKLADKIYAAVGQPTRAQLKARQTASANRKQSKAVGAMPKGLTAPQRFTKIRQDLEDIKRHYGGRIPAGLRNTWLHMYSVCLTHCTPSSNIAAEIEAQAADATPGLGPTEVAGIIRAAEKAIETGFEAKYLYGGDTIAELLGISAEVAQRLGLMIVMPTQERSRRNAVAEEKRRRAKGAVSRGEYLNQNSIEEQKPWEGLNQSRATWYRHRAKAKAAAQPVEDIAQEENTDAAVRLVRCRYKGNQRFRAIARDEQSVLEASRAAQPPLRDPARPPARGSKENRECERQAGTRKEKGTRENSFRASPPPLRGRPETNPTHGSDPRWDSGSATRHTEEQNGRRSCHRVIPPGAAPEDRNVLHRPTGSRGPA
ncbi:MAG: DNA-primase RepB domain-containing protein [Sulfitobacter sp.]|nr:DNA-primase RepB domain-containing protein [Sulfitobacter sp.]